MKRMDPPATTTSKTMYKRAKSIQACSNCRKHKVRCDPPSREEETTTFSRRCHRCKVLDLPCSFQDSDSVVGQSISSPTSAPIASTSTSASTRTAPLPSQPLSLSALACARALTPDDLFPVDEHPWGAPQPLPGQFDWTAMPLLAIHELTRPKSRSPNPPVVNHADVSIDQVLTRDQIAYLLDIFERNYSPWLNLPLQSDKATSPFLDLVRCMVASRHLDDVTRSNVVSRLEKLSEEAYLRQIFNPMPTEESIQALLIFSLWAPIGEVTRQEGRDDRLLAASTISLAENLSLSKSFEYVINLRKEGVCKGSVELLAPEKRAAIHEAKHKARLWCAISNVESILCMGTERTATGARSIPISNRQGQQLTLSVGTMESARNCRLLQSAQLLELTQEGTKLKLIDTEGFEKFYIEASGVLSKMTSLYRRLLPLPVIARHEAFQFHILLLTFHVCKLLVILHYIREVRSIFDHRDKNRPPWYKMQHHGVGIFADWFRDAAVHGEAAMVQLLSNPDPALLSTMPDYVFILVSFAAVSTITAKSAFLFSHNIVLSGYNDITSSMVVDLLKQVKHAQPHADLIATCLKLFDEKVAKRAELDPTFTPSQHAQPAITSHDVTNIIPGDESVRPDGIWGEEGQQFLQFCEFDFDFGALPNPSVLLDSELLSLMNNLSEPPAVSTA